MSKTKIQREARDLMARHPGVKYTEALAVVKGERGLDAVLAKAAERTIEAQR